MDFEVGDRIYWTNKSGWDFAGTVLAVRRWTVKVRVTLTNGPVTFWTRPSRLKKQTSARLRTLLSGIGSLTRRLPNAVVGDRVADPTPTPAVMAHAMTDSPDVGAHRDVLNPDKGGTS